MCPLPWRSIVRTARWVMWKKPARFTAVTAAKSRGVYTNKAPGGVAYRCSFRVTEAMFFQERMVQAAASDLGIDQAEFRRMNFVRDDDFPHRTPFGFLTDSGQYAKCLDVGLKAIGYENFREEQAEARKQGRLL